MARKPTRTITMAATKGGVGKTTLSTALAVRASERGDRVAMIDRDPQESLGSWCDRRGGLKGPKLFDVDSTAEAIGLIQAEGFDWLIIDTPPAMLPLIEDAIAQSDLVIIPTRASALDLLAVDPVIDLCRTHGKPYAFVINSADPRQKLTKTAAQYLSVHGRVFETIVAQRVAYVAAMTNGKGPTEVDKTGSTANELDALWAEIEKAMAAATKKRART